MTKFRWGFSPIRSVKSPTSPRSIPPPLGDRPIAVADSLAEFPERGRDAGNGLREMTTVRPYVLRYRVETERVVILRVRHSAGEEEEEGG